LAQHSKANPGTSKVSRAPNKAAGSKGANKDKPSKGNKAGAAKVALRAAKDNKVVDRRDRVAKAVKGDRASRRIHLGRVLAQARVKVKAARATTPYWPRCC
jgi:hypothetical protein